MEVDVQNLCPTCEQPIAYEHAEEIRRRIENKERREAEAVEERIVGEVDVARREATEVATKAMEAELAQADQMRAQAEAGVAALKENLVPRAGECSRGDRGGHQGHGGGSGQG